MTPAEIERFAELNESLSQDIQVELIESDHEKSPVIKQFCDELAQRVPKIRIKKEAGDPDEAPSIRIHDGLRYQAIPEGTEIGPFIEAIQLKDTGAARLEASTAARLAKIDLPTHLTIYVSPRCTFCPGVVRQLLPLLTLNTNIRLTVVDTMHFPEFAEKDNIQSVPTLILEGQFRWTGTIQINEIIEMMVNRDPGVLGPSSLEMMLKEGNAGRLAEMMLNKMEIFPAFYELLLHAKWPVRLGAMVAMEEIIAKNPDLAVQTIKPLWQKFDEVDNRVKGDLVYILGQMAPLETIPLLEIVLKGEYAAEVKEAAREALEDPS
ncbi:MAG: thioredoxin family protein [Deltaproteobacteria bacterium]|jgi:glutaredoxin|nr:thioredoxin family protein [Deltaproteobacteria bacterium]MBW2483261.1 thioredoxin family protein [Deltaproteobacteria bacterium]